MRNRMRFAGNNVVGSSIVRDPYYSSVVSLLSFDGNLTDAKGRTWTAVGNAAATGTAKFGSASLALDGTGDQLTGDGNAAWAFGAAEDFTFEGFIRSSVVQDDKFVIDMRGATDTNALFLVTGGPLSTYPTGVLLGVFAGLILQSTTRIDQDNTYRHFAFTRQGTTMRLFIEGIKEAETTNAAFNRAFSNYASNPVIGGNSFGGSNWNGNIDEFRITKGVARYTANFTPPTAAFPRA